MIRLNVKTGIILILCKVHADESQVIRSGRIDRSDRGGIGILYQGLALARKSHTPIIGSEIGSLG